jgi:hypothetical protein
MQRLPFIYAQEKSISNKYTHNMCHCLHSLAREIIIIDRSTMFGELHTTLHIFLQKIHDTWHYDIN